MEEAKITTKSFHELENCEKKYYNEESSQNVVHSPMKVSFTEHILTNHYHLLRFLASITSE